MCRISYCPCAGQILPNIPAPHERLNRPHELWRKATASSSELSVYNTLPWTCLTWAVRTQVSDVNPQLSKVTLELVFSTNLHSPYIKGNGHYTSDHDRCSTLKLKWWIHDQYVTGYRDVPTAVLLGLLCDGIHFNIKKKIMHSDLVWEILFACSPCNFNLMCISSDRASWIEYILITNLKH